MERRPVAIIFELGHSGDGVTVKQSDSQFEYSASRAISATTANRELDGAALRTGDIGLFDNSTRPPPARNPGTELKTDRSCRTTGTTVAV
jgi:hypothetical protein